MASVLRQSLRLSTVFADGLSTRSLLNLRFNRTNLIHIGRTAFGVQNAEAEAAKERSYAWKEDPGTKAKLQMYALYKQDEAKMQHVQIINGLGEVEAPAGEKASRFKDIKVTKENKVCTIMLNRPAKKNALSLLMYNEIIQALDQASKDDSITAAVITGAGDCYSSGMDWDIYMDVDLQPKDMKKVAGEIRGLLLQFVAAFIDFPKPLVAAVNGPAVGIGASPLGLFDAVYASDRSLFLWACTKRGKSPEGCASYIFPKIMGNAKANEVLLFNKKLTAREACERGLVTEVFPHDNFQKEVQARVDYIAQLPPKSVMESKKLIRDHEREKLHKANEKECEVLEGRWLSEECLQAIMTFLAKRAN